MSNYPDGTNMGDYDEYFFPKMECGHSSDETKPLRFIPQNKLEEARVCDGCYAEYIEEIKTKELIK